MCVWTVLGGWLHVWVEVITVFVHLLFVASRDVLLQFHDMEIAQHTL